ncbi:IPT/TIG domain-containing protein [Atribacter laminatus]|uniref:Maltogenic alpha-amylase n=1 Tax=Atribacter laminatus TaxID=2847778 RepID=A0A7T1AME0_ATRLM|nr:IPT/TIG domain-containing protein [Atribacter laminatus]QPM68533.1 Maltogenic alpha-amylase [Atribacter laminatus]
MNLKKIFCFFILLFLVVVLLLVISGCLPQSLEPSPTPSPTTTPSIGSEPHIESMFPLSGTPGTKLTVLGSGFGTSQGSSQLIFRRWKQTSIDLNVITWSDTSITAGIPLTAEGIYQLIVLVNGVESNALEFKVFEGTNASQQTVPSCPSCGR